MVSRSFWKGRSPIDLFARQVKDLDLDSGRLREGVAHLQLLIAAIAIGCKRVRSGLEIEDLQRGGQNLIHCKTSLLRAGAIAGLVPAFHLPKPLSGPQGLGELQTSLQSIVDLLLLFSAFLPYRKAILTGRAVPFPSKPHQPVAHLKAGQKQHRRQRRL